MLDKRNCHNIPTKDILAIDRCKTTIHLPYNQSTVFQQVYHHIEHILLLSRCVEPAHPGNLHGIVRTEPRSDKENWAQPCILNIVQHNSLVCRSTSLGNLLQMQTIKQVQVKSNTFFSQIFFWTPLWKSASRTGNLTVFFFETQ